MRTFLPTILLAIGCGTINAVQAGRIRSYNDAEEENALLRRRILQTSMSLSTVEGLKGAEGMYAPRDSHT